MNLDYYAKSGVRLTETAKEQIRWFIGLHNSANQKYDGYLPYEFHLHAVGRFAMRFLHLETDSILDDYLRERVQEDIIVAAYGHDVLEDLSVSFNDVVSKTNKRVADIVYSCTTEKGRSRKERFNEKFYETLINTDYAVFVKLCDRLANVWYGKLTKSDMLNMYKKEQESFIQKIYQPRFAPIVDLIDTYLI